MNDVFKIAAYVPISRELWRELDQERNPWRYADPPIRFDIDPLPRLTALTRLANRVRQRLADIAYVIRHGIPEESLYE